MYFISQCCPNGSPKLSNIELGKYLMGDHMGIPGAVCKIIKVVIAIVKQYLMNFNNIWNVYEICYLCQTLSIYLFIELSVVYSD